MRTKLVLIASILVALPFVLLSHITSALPYQATAVATQAANPDCNPTLAIKALATIKSTGDIGKDKTTLEQLRIDINAVLSACDSLPAGTLIFTGKSNQSVGPATLSDGAYRVVIRGKATMAGVVNMKTLDGDCDTIMLMITPSGGIDTSINALKGKDAEGSATIVTKGCKAMFDMTNMLNWTLYIEPLQ